MENQCDPITKISCLYCNECMPPRQCTLKMATFDDSPYGIFRMFASKLYHIYTCTNLCDTIMCKKCRKTIGSPIIVHHIVCYLSDLPIPKPRNMRLRGYVNNSVMEYDDYRITFSSYEVILHDKTRRDKCALTFVKHDWTFTNFPQLLFLNIDYFSLLTRIMKISGDIRPNEHDVADALLELTPQCLFTGKYYDSWPPINKFSNFVLNTKFGEQ